MVAASFEVVVSMHLVNHVSSLVSTRLPTFPEFFSTKEHLTCPTNPNRPASKNPAPSPNRAPPLPARRSNRTAPPTTSRKAPQRPPRSPQRAPATSPRQHD